MENKKRIKNTTLMQYPVFRKTFHVPGEWTKSDDIMYLVNHSYATVQAQEAFVEISGRLKRLGYMEDNDRMIHDYLHFFLQDVFDKNGEVYLTETDIRGSEPIFALLNETTPDFVLKRGNGRKKTTIIDVYVGGRAVSDVKSKYKTLGFFADLVVVTPGNFPQQLRDVVPVKDIDYLYKHFQVFQTEYYYWKSCLKLKKILFNDVANVPVEEYAVADTNTLSRERYRVELAKYAENVRAQDEI